jgi:hypothetical protein
MRYGASMSACGWRMAAGSPISWPYPGPGLGRLRKVARGISRRWLPLRHTARRLAGGSAYTTWIGGGSAETWGAAPGTSATSVAPADRDRLETGPLPDGGFPARGAALGPTNDDLGLLSDDLQLVRAASGTVAGFCWTPSRTSG